MVVAEPTFLSIRLIDGRLQWLRNEAPMPRAHEHVRRHCYRAAVDGTLMRHDFAAGLMPRKSAFNFSTASAERPADLAATSTALTALSLNSASIFFRVSLEIFLACSAAVSARAVIISISAVSPSAASSPALLSI